MCVARRKRSFGRSERLVTAPTSRSSPSGVMHLANVAGSFSRSMPQPCCLSCDVHARGRTSRANGKTLPSGKIATNNIIIKLDSTFIKEFALLPSSQFLETPFVAWNQARTYYTYTTALLLQQNMVSLKPSDPPPPPSVPSSIMHRQLHNRCPCSKA